MNAERGKSTTVFDDDDDDDDFFCHNMSIQFQGMAAFYCELLNYCNKLSSFLFLKLRNVFSVGDKDVHILSNVLLLPLQMPHILKWKILLVLLSILFIF